MIAKSLTERRCLIATYGKRSTQVLDPYFLCENSIYRTFQIITFVETHRRRNGLRSWSSNTLTKKFFWYISPMPKVYVDIERWKPRKISKGVPNRIKAVILKTEQHEERILSSLLGGKVKPEEVHFRMFEVVPHTHDIITVNVEKVIYNLFNLKVHIPDDWIPEQGDFQTKALWHKDIKPEYIFDLETQREQCVKNHSWNNPEEEQEYGVAIRDSRLKRRKEKICISIQNLDEQTLEKNSRRRK